MTSKPLKIIKKKKKKQNKNKKLKKKNIYIYKTPVNVGQTPPSTSSPPHPHAKTYQACAHIQEQKFHHSNQYQGFGIKGFCKDPHNLDGAPPTHLVETSAL